MEKDVPNKTLPPLHPGEYLKEEFLIPLKISQYRLAKELKVTEYTISKIVRGKSSITADMSMRLSRFFGNSAEFWLNLQKEYELDCAKERFDELEINNISPFVYA